MKITHVCKIWYPGTTGVTVHVDCLSRWMTRAGHDVSVVTYDLSGDLPDGVDILSGKKDGYNVIKVRPGNTDRFQRAVAETRSDAIHAHGIWEHVLPSWQAAKSSHARFYITSHGTWQFLNQSPGMESWKRRLYFRWYYHTGWRRMVRDADAMIALNNIEEKAYRRLGAGKVHRIPNGVDCQEFYPENRLILSQEFDLPDKFIFYAGAVQTQKGIFTLLEALVRLKRNGINPLLIVAGDGPDLNQAIEMAEKENLNVKFIGRVDRPHMSGLMARADLFVLPSENEPFATVYLEAMASGTPCVGTNTGGTPEIIDPYKTGFLIPVNGVAELASILAKVDKDPTKVKHLGENARHKAVTYFDWSILVPKILEAYSS